MKIISKVILFVFLFISGSIYSQSPWGTKDNTKSNNGIWKNSSSETQPIGNSLRTDPGGPGDQPPGGKDNASPIGEGLVLLSLLSGGYFMLKRRNPKD